MGKAVGECAWGGASSASPEVGLIPAPRRGRRGCSGRHRPVTLPGWPPAWGNPRARANKQLGVWSIATPIGHSGAFEPRKRPSPLPAAGHKGDKLPLPAEQVVYDCGTASLWSQHFGHWGTAVTRDPSTRKDFSFNYVTRASTRQAPITLPQWAIKILIIHLGALQARSIETLRPTTIGKSPRPTNNVGTAHPPGKGRVDSGRALTPSPH